MNVHAFESVISFAFTHRPRESVSASRVVTVPPWLSGVGVWLDDNVHRKMARRVGETHGSYTRLEYKNM